jgi:hypothetical protein
VAGGTAGVGASHKLLKNSKTQPGGRDHNKTGAKKGGTDTGKGQSSRMDWHIQQDRAAARAADEAAAAKARRHDLRQLAREKEKGKGQAMSNSMLRMAFGSPLPSLADLAYIEEQDDCF